MVPNRLPPPPFAMRTRRTMLLMTHSQDVMFVWLLCCSLFLSLSHVHARRYSSSSSSQSHRLPSSVVTSTLASSTSHWGVQLSKRRNRLVSADEWKRSQSTAAFDLLQQRLLRGGASVDVADKEANKEEKDETKNEPNVASTQRDDQDHPPSVMSPEPVDVVVYTAVGNKWLDLSLELTVLRSRDLAFLKQSVSKSLPGKPPKQLIQFRYQGRLLTDDHMLVDELMTELEEEEGDDDDVDADNEESSKKLKLQLEMIPPVESRFALTMIQTRPFTQWTASELLDAYTTNAAAMYTHAQYLLQEEEDKEDGPVPPQNDDDSNVSVTAQLQQKAQLLREDLEATFPEKVRAMLEAQRQEVAAAAAAADGSTATTASSSTTLSAAGTAPGTVQQRGQRYRVTGGGATTNLKRVIQRNLNLNWGDTIRTVGLLLFFGFCGAPNAWSKYLLLVGAPVSIVIQARPAKYMLKRLFYAMTYPPAVLSSLLPAPQQAILNFHAREAYAAIYPTLAAAAAKRAREQAGADAKAANDEEQEEEDDGDKDDDEVEEDDAEVDEDDEDEEEEDED